MLKINTNLHSTLGIYLLIEAKNCAQWCSDKNDQETLIRFNWHKLVLGVGA